jgi:hypothetical protein
MAPTLDRQLVNSVAEAYPRLRRELLSPLLQLLLAARSQGEGDIDKFILLLVVAIRTVEHPDFARQTPEEMLQNGAESLPTLGANVRSIADSVGIPKETVRRKVAELLAMGLIGRTGNNLYFTASSYQALTPVREAIQRAAVAFYEAVAKVDDARRALGGAHEESASFRPVDASGPSVARERR